jgi:alpha-ketoglutarate-dependent taurine dioxygenase
MKITQPVNTLNYKDYKKKYKELSEKILLELNTIGFIIIKNFEITDDLEETKNNLLGLNNLIGTPIGHDINDKIIWDIKSNPSSNSFIKTYSEHTHEAELHTDSQYSHYPEDYFSLLTLKKADCGGGISYILTLEDILDELKTLENAKEVERVLRETDFPFIVPNVFKKNNSDAPEYNFGPILREREIRFRIDTFEKAVLSDDSLCTKEQVEAYKELKKLVLNSTKTKKFYLENNDLVFLNNKTLLHGRSLFTDEKRHLLRIRMNKK